MSLLPTPARFHCSHKQAPGPPQVPTNRHASKHEDSCIMCGYVMSEFAALESDDFSPRTSVKRLPFPPWLLCRSLLLTHNTYLWGTECEPKIEFYNQSCALSCIQKIETPPSSEKKGLYVTQFPFKTRAAVLEGMPSEGTKNTCGKET
jgi:hypothetical protein